MLDLLAAVDRLALAALVPLAVAILLSGLDDLIVDAAWAWLWLRSKLRPAASLFPPGPRQLEAARKARVAILVPLWREHEVIGRMLEHNLGAIRYPDYHFFAGCYPNDEPTQAAVRAIGERFPNIHLALCPHDGPTSKADCLNWIYQHLRLYEEREGTRFDIVITHDAEDLIHPEELSWINYYIARYDFVQTPVLPLPTPLTALTHGVYCDEFAEYHARDMTVRAALGGFVPSSGVGTGYRREALEALAAASANRVFSPEALTEDYENGLRLFRLGASQAFVPIVPHGPRDFVATREYFPGTFRGALRQRTRWVTGIALQSWERFGWRGRAREVYWLWRDRKGLVANPLSAAANAVFLYGLASGLWQRASPAALRLSGITLGLMLLRMAVRIACVARIYGWWFALGAPVRAIYANGLNSAAAAGAVVRYAAARLRSRPLRWLKTEHAYPHRAALLAHKRPLGEILVATGRAHPAVVAEALAARPTGVRLGEFLASAGRLTWDSLYEALSFQQGLPVAHIQVETVPKPVAWSLPEHVVRRWRILPFRVADRALHLASPDAPSAELAAALGEFTTLEPRFHLVTPPEFDRLAAALL
jgi:adsorption protein B